MIATLLQHGPRTNQGRVGQTLNKPKRYGIAEKVEAPVALTIRGLYADHCVSRTARLGFCVSKIDAKLKTSRHGFHSFGPVLQRVPRLPLIERSAVPDYQVVGRASSCPHQPATVDEGETGASVGPAHITSLLVHGWGTHVARRLRPARRLHQAEGKTHPRKWDIQASSQPLNGQRPGCGMTSPLVGDRWASTAHHMVQGSVGLDDTGERVASVIGHLGYRPCASDASQCRELAPAAVLTASQAGRGGRSGGGAVPYALGRAA